MTNLPHSKLVINEHITLEQLEPRDAESLFSVVAANSDYLAKFLPWPSKTKMVQDSADFINRVLKKRESGDEYGYGIKYDDQIIGHASIMHISDEDGKLPEIGYWISEEFSGKGITTAVARGLTGLGLNVLNFSEMIIRAETTNIGSNRVAQKCGYIQSGSDVEDGRDLNVWKVVSEGE